MTGGRAVPGTPLPLARTSPYGTWNTWHESAGWGSPPEGSVAAAAPLFYPCTAARIASLHRRSFL